MFSGNLAAQFGRFGVEGVHETFCFFLEGQDVFTGAFFAGLDVDIAIAGMAEHTDVKGKAFRNFPDVEGKVRNL